MNTRDSFLPFALPLIESDELELVRETLLSGWITTGPVVKKFEAEFAKYVGAKHAIAVNSCTAAMHLALEAINLKPGDYVITSPYTFAATAEVIRYFKARPIFVDIERKTFNLDADKLEVTIKKLRRNISNSDRIKAIIPIHVAGQSCDIDSINSIAKKYNLHVIEDAAHALPTKFNNRLIGSLSDFTCFSFYATKTITTGEGGMICTDNDEWADRCRIMSLHGISRDAWKRYTAQGSWFYEIIAPGFKYNMTDVAAAIGVCQLGKCERMWLRRSEIARFYSNELKGVKEVVTPDVALGRQHAWHLYILQLELNSLKCDRKQFIEELKALNIGSSVHFIPLHIHPYYRDRYKISPNAFPVAYDVYQRAVSLPIYPKMTDNDAVDVIKAIKYIAEKFRKIN